MHEHDQLKISNFVISVGTNKCSTMFSYMSCDFGHEIFDIEELSYKSFRNFKEIKK